MNDPNNPFDTARGWLDLEEAQTTTGLPDLAPKELAKLLGVAVDSEGIPIDYTEFLNACLNILTNKNVLNLPKDQRLQAIRSAAPFLDR